MNQKRCWLTLWAFRCVCMCMTQSTQGSLSSGVVLQHAPLSETSDAQSLEVERIIWGLRKAYMPLSPRRHLMSRIGERELEEEPTSSTLREQLSKTIKCLNIHARALHSHLSLRHPKLKYKALIFTWRIWFASPPQLAGFTRALLHFKVTFVRKTLHVSASHLILSLASCTVNYNLCYES